MKKPSCYLGGIWALVSISLFGNDPVKNKLYVDSGNIKVIPEGLFLELEKGLLPIESVSKDEKGIFVVASAEKQILYCLNCNLEFDLDLQSPYCPHLSIK